MKTKTGGYNRIFLFSFFIAVKMYILTWDSLSVCLRIKWLSWLRKTTGIRKLLLETAAVARFICEIQMSVLECCLLSPSVTQR